MTPYPTYMVASLLPISWSPSFIFSLMGLAISSFLSIPGDSVSSSEGWCLCLFFLRFFGFTPSSAPKWRILTPR